MPKVCQLPTKPQFNLFNAASLLDFTTTPQRNDDTTSSALRAECPQRLPLGGSGS